MKKILIVSNNQFGYLTDTLKYCEYLGNKYKIEVICVDNGLAKIINENIKVHYVKTKNKYIKRIIFLKALKKILGVLNPDLIFIDYFVGCSTVKLFFGNRFVYNLDIRTGSVCINKYKRKLMNLLLKAECRFFENISIISKGLKEELRINNTTIHWLPLGADLNLTNKDNSIEKSECKNYKLIYVGTLLRRNIWETVLGLKYFFDMNYDETFNISYDIIGFSNNLDDEEIIKKYINDFGLTDIIKFHGRLNYNSALEFISKADIGISYIPITEYFNFQPPTKTFEYLLSGIPCIATNTFENAQIITKINGVIINDTPKDFCNGLYKLLNYYQQYKSDEIVSSVKDYTWENIVFNNLEPYINYICK